jgi:hypothetical protein
MGASSEIAVGWWSLRQFVSGRYFRQALKEIEMKKTLSALTAAAMIAGTLAATATDASAQWRRHGWGWGPGVAAGIIGGAIITGAILASRPRGYVVYEGYGQPVYGPGCYWASQPVYDRYGNVVGYTGQPVQICPGYRY